MGLTSKAFSDIITFSRSSNATRVGPDGKIAYAPHNLLTYSEQLDNAAWNQSSMTVTANSVAAPNGTTTADKLIANTTNTYHQVSESVTTVASVVYAFSVYLKMGESRYANLLMNNNGGFSAIGVDMQAGTIVTNSVSVTQAVGSIQSVGNGWYRATVFVQAASTSIEFRITASNSANTNWSFAGDGSSGFYAWGAQVSAGSIAGDYTATTSAAVYGPRFDYDPVTLAAKGLLIEEQRTNLITYSEQFDNAAWLKSNATVTPSATTAPDGTVTADSLLENSISSIHGCYESITITAGVVYTNSYYVKSNGRTFFRIYIVDGGGGNGVYADFNLSAAISQASAIGSGASASSSIVNVGNGWYRCSVTGTPGGAITTITNSLYMQTSYQGSINYTGDGTSGVYLWGAQLEAGAFATSYIPTVASTVTRSADAVSVSATSPWFNAVEGTLYAEAAPLIANTGASRGIFGLSGGTSSNSISLYINSSGSLSGGYIVNGGAAQADFTPTYSNKTALAYKANDVNMGAGGAIGTTDTSATIPTISQVQLGDIYGGTSFKLNGWLRRIAYYPRRLTNAELQALTA